MGTKDPAECVRNHPKDALAAWQRVIQIEPASQGAASPTQDFYENQWKAEGAFEGLNKQRKVNATSLRPLGADVHQTSNVNAQYSIDTLLDTFPDAGSAANRACVRGAGWSKQQLKDPGHKAQWGKKCGTLQSCYTVGEDGLFEDAEDAAKKAIKKSGGGPVGVRGYCLGDITAKKSNLKARARYSLELDLLNQRVQELERRNATLTQLVWEDGCVV